MSITVIDSCSPFPFQIDVSNYENEQNCFWQLLTLNVADQGQAKVKVSKTVFDSCKPLPLQIMVINDEGKQNFFRQFFTLTVADQDQKLRKLTKKYCRPRLVLVKVNKTVPTVAHLYRKFRNWTVKKVFCLFPLETSTRDQRSKIWRIFRPSRRSQADCQI